MKTTITVLILGLVCLSNIAQSKYFDYEGAFADQVSIRQQAYHNEVTIDNFFGELKNLIDAIKKINAAIPKGSRSPISEIDQLSKIKLDMCTSCENTVWAARNATDKDAMKEKLEKMAEALCETKENSSVCTEAVSRYGEVVWPAVMDRSFDASRLCGKLHFCPDNTKKQTIKEYVDEILADKPATNIPTPTKKSSYTIMHLTDPHIDLEYQEGAASVCSQPLCCRASDGQPTNASEAAGYWGTVAYCDIPLRTFDQYLQFSSKNFDIDMIVWTGDNIAHNVWEQSQDNQTVNTYDATQHILQYFPNTTVYPMFGNHEAFPCDEFDFIGNNSAWLTSQLADMWKIWLDEESLATLRANSYYSVVDPVHNVKIIALDTVACDALDFYLFENPTDPQNQLAWLRSELYASESAEQAVFIIGHIPPGEFTCDSEWSSRYRALVDRFTNIIRGQFFGHTHDDEIEVVRSWADNSPVGVVHIAPSLTTYSTLQPSFRIFEIDSDTHVLLNYYQYRLDVNKWNKNTTGPIEWDLAYDVLSEYNLADMSFASFDNLAEKIKQDEETAALYQFNKYSGSDKKKKVDARDVQHLYCKAKNSVSADALKCLGLDATVSDRLEIAAQSLPGGWTYTTF